MFRELDRERRRIERALHDGVQQDLAATSVALQFAVQLLDSDIGEARRLLEELELEVRSALQRVSALAHGIYPSILAARGLAGALAGRAEMVGVGRLPLETEEAVYFACSGLLDDAKSARVWTEGEALRFDVAAQSRFADAAIAHARDRLTSVGGQLTVSAGGALVEATVPTSSSAR